jgi:hypothetical protein
MDIFATVMITAAVCGLPVLYLHDQLRQTKIMLRDITDERDQYERAAERPGADAYALRQALANARGSTRDPRRLAESHAPRSWGPS